MKKEMKDLRDGRFYTPECFARKAHEYISSVLGESWTDEYVVYDPACGEKALTKDLVFKELYCSTLEGYELDNCKELNPEGVAFQFDFLNDYIPSSEELFGDETKLPESLMSALRNDKPFVFFMNPPYATSSIYSVEGGNHKAGTCKTKTNLMMKEDGYGASASNLYAQFLYRILWLVKEYHLTDVTVAMFTPNLYLSGTNFAKFREKWLTKFRFEKGFMLSAGEFS